MTFDKAFVEITNICNLSCSFCAHHSRALGYMSCDEFENILSKLDGKVKYLYLHLMGEPLTHPDLENILKATEEHDFKLILTTNGTFLGKHSDTLIAAKKLFKVSISLHSFEGSDHHSQTLEDYLTGAVDFAKKSASAGIITVFRLWNRGGADSFNDVIVDRLHSLAKELGSTPTPNRSGERLGDKLFIEWGDMFKWPQKDAQAAKNADSERFCYALRDQFGILTDGTVVPCCLDHDGALALGNIFEKDLEEIVSSPRARAIYDGFTRHTAVEDYCKTCRKNPGS